MKKHIALSTLIAFTITNALAHFSPVVPYYLSVTKAKEEASKLVDICPLPELGKKAFEVTGWIFKRPFIHINRWQKGWLPEHTQYLYRDLALLGGAGIAYGLYCAYNHIYWVKRDKPNRIEGLAL